MKWGPNGCLLHGDIYLLSGIQMNSESGEIRAKISGGFVREKFAISPIDLVEKFRTSLKIILTDRMNILILLAAALTCIMAGELPAEMKEMAQGLHDGCVEETGVDNGLIGPCAKGNFAEDPKLKCYFKCVFGNLGVISDEGELDAEAFGSILPDDMQELLPTIRGCAGTTGADPCELAMNFNKCLQKADPVNFMVI